MKTVIETKDLHKTYTETEIEVKAVNGISLSFSEGEFAAIVGPSGCGKTTLLNLLGGLDAPTSGAVIIDSVDISTLSSRKMIDFRMNNIGFVFQAYNLIPVLTAKENAEFIMNLQKKPKAEREARIAELFKAIGIEGKENIRPSRLSGGQQQRVAVARALASKPKFILADEPTANLDSKATTELLDIMRKLNEEEKITFIFATHDQRVIDRARRVVYLDDGKVTSDKVK
ncbi:MAG: ABC transporter ATP-binding protein [Bacteroidetes bacterium]|nr:MAG: ABC transporter ATP-binding protein [Bacteroidota bacterium]